MPTPRVALTVRLGAGGTNAWWLVRQHTSRHRLIDMCEGRLGFSCRVPFGPVAAFLRTNHQHPEENPCLIYPPRSSDGT